jgi:hypothetical protein
VLANSEYNYADRAFAGEGGCSSAAPTSAMSNCISAFRLNAFWKSTVNNLLMKQGDSVVIPSDAPHKATANEKCCVLDIFVPARNGLPVMLSPHRQNLINDGVLMD